MRRKVTKFDITGYTQAQIIDALLCPVNRDMTRREHACTDEDLWRDGGRWLMEHYIKFGGAKAWAKHRPEYEHTVEVDIPVWVIVVERIRPPLARVPFFITRILHLGAVVSHQIAC